MSNKFVCNLKGKPYLELIVLSGENIIKKIYMEDKGQELEIDKGLDMAFVIPHRKYGLRQGKCTTFFFSSHNVVPLSLEDVDTDGGKILYEEGSESQKCEKIYFNSSKRKNLEYTYIEPALLKRFIDTKIVGDLLKPVESPYEALIKPIMFIGALLFVGYLIFMIL